MPQTNKITALYCRLSQEDARLGESESIQNQKIILERYAKEHRFTNIQFFIDDGISGVSFEREGLQAMIDEVEAGNVSTVITKDLSRLGRNYLKTGELIEIIFPENGVRYIAISDNVDTARDDNDFMPLRNWVNEFYARDTSKKIRAVKYEKARRGERSNGKCPYGYLIDPDDKNHLIPDEETAPIVRKIFELYANGASYSKICDWLKENKICTPSETYHRRGGAVPYRRPHPDCIYNWNEGLIMTILSRREYIGTTVTNKGHNVSYKIKRRKENSDEERFFFENTHEPIVDTGDFAAAQKRLSTPHIRRNKCNEIDLFSGLLFCADCGRKMNVLCAAYDCGGYRNQSRSGQLIKCTSHYMSKRALKDVVLKDLRRVLMRVNDSEREFVSVAAQSAKSAAAVAVKRNKRELEKAETRLNELKVLFRKSYEDNALGKISDEQFSFLTGDFDSEKSKLEARISELKKEADLPNEQSANVKKFVTLAKKYVDLSELNYENLHALIDRILIHELDENDVRAVEIFYSFIGKIANDGEPVKVSYKVRNKGNKVIWVAVI